MDEIRKRWKQAATELNKLKSQNQGLYQVTDQHLIDLTRGLRYNIRIFAIKYFGHQSPSRYRRDEIQEFQRNLTHFKRKDIPASTNYLLSPEKRPCIIQAYLWTILVPLVFGKYIWAGHPGVSLSNLDYYLKPSKNDE